MVSPSWDLISNANPHYVESLHGILWILTPKGGQGPQALTMARIKNSQPPTDHRLPRPIPHWPLKLNWTDMDGCGPYQSSCLDALRHVLYLNSLKPPVLVLNPHRQLPHCLRAKTSSRAVLAQILVRPTPEPRGSMHKAT